MPWEKIAREDTFEGGDLPYISISTHLFGFNAIFVRVAEINTSFRVTVYTDEKARKMGFEFHKDQRLDSFTLGSYGSPHRGHGRTSIGCTSVGVFRKHAWIEAVSRLPTKLRRFVPRREANLWAIQLCPAFEIRKARESGDIPVADTGIYRYVREDGEEVYIGHGSIKVSLSQAERADWTFDIIEYSVVDDPDEQLKWKEFWIGVFAEQHRGDRPIYNKMSGV